MCYDKAILGSTISIPPSESPSGEGARYGFVKQMVTEKALLEKEYYDDLGGIIFTGSSQLYLSTNKAHRAVEKIGPSTKAMWESIRRVKANKGDEVDLVMSFGHKKMDVDAPEEDFDYSSDHSTMIFRKEIVELSPEKFDGRNSAGE